MTDSYVLALVKYALDNEIIEKSITFCGECCA